MTRKGGSPMLCTLSSLCSAELPCREEAEADQEQEEEGEKEEEEMRRPHAMHPQQLLQR